LFRISIFEFRILFVVPSNSCGNDREEKMRSSVRGDVQRRLAPENLGRPVPPVVVEKRPATFKFVLEVRKPPAAWSLVFVISGRNFLISD
jgi:hypothetical protein